MCDNRNLQKDRLGNRDSNFNYILFKLLVFLPFPLRKFAKLPLIKSVINTVKPLFERHLYLNATSNRTPLLKKG